MAKLELAAPIAAEVQRLHGFNIPGSKQPQVWHDIFKFINKGLTTTFYVHNVITFYRRLVTTLVHLFVVFVHNDLLSSNLMFNEEEG
jgi:ethanolamine kinase